MSERLRTRKVRQQLVSILMAFAIALGVATAISVTNATPAVATVSTPSWWSGDCDVKNDPGSYALGASYNGVKACGPGPNQGGTDYMVHFFTGAWGEYEWECVELAMRYMYLVYGISPYSANGSTVVSNYSGSTLTDVANDGNNLPTPGDIISEGATNTFGHTAVVTAVSVTNGTGTVTTMEENNDSNGWNSITVSGGKLGSGVTGWLHNPNSTSGSGGETSSFQATFQANNNNLYSYDSSNGPAAYNLSMPANTSPSTTSVSGGYETAYQATTGHLIVYGASLKTDTQQGMLPGTSPSIAASSSSFEVAFQANNANLYTYNSSSGPAAYNLPMASGTSPAIAAVSGGYQMAYQSNAGDLVLYGTSVKGNTNMPMMADTSPSITALPNGGYEVAYQSNAGDLIVYGTGKKVNTGQGMLPGTSPSIAASSSGAFQVAFQANNNNLYTYDSSAGPAAYNLPMPANTSPSITAVSGGYEIAYQSNTGNLIVYGASQKVDTGQGMLPGTSPSIG
jgi:hypothetical protein